MPPGRGKGGGWDEPDPVDSAAMRAREALGRSRGGLTTKRHLACDGRGRPLSVVLTPGQRLDSTQLEPILDGIRVPRPGGGSRLGSLQASGPTYRRVERALDRLTTDVASLGL
jgi:hypothetical protein